MKENKTKKINTCQICGRVIKANTGIIAHHGYKRLGGGWQTASCNGARYLPYEISCDRLPPTIKTIEDFIDSQNKRLKDFISNSPESLIMRKSTWEKEVKTVIKPEGFNPGIETSEKYRFRTYENEYHYQKYQIETTIKYAKSDLTFMKERLAKWVPPKKEAK